MISAVKIESRRSLTGLSISAFWLRFPTSSFSFGWKVRLNLVLFALFLLPLNRCQSLVPALMELLTGGSWPLVGLPIGGSPPPTRGRLNLWIVRNGWGSRQKKTFFLCVPTFLLNSGVIRGVVRPKTGNPRSKRLGRRRKASAVRSLKKIVIFWERLL